MAWWCYRTIGGSIKKEFRVTSQRTFLCALGQEIGIRETGERLGNGACVCASVFVCEGKQQCKHERQGEWLLRQWQKGIQPSMHTFNRHMFLIEYYWARSRPAMVVYTHANAPYLSSLLSLHTSPLLLVLPDSKARVHRLVVAFPAIPLFTSYFPSSPSLPFSSSLLSHARACSYFVPPTPTQSIIQRPCAHSPSLNASNLLVLSCCLCAFLFAVVCCWGRACDKQTVTTFALHGCSQSSQPPNSLQSMLSEHKACIMVEHIVCEAMPIAPLPSLLSTISLFFFFPRS